MTGVDLALIVIRLLIGGWLLWSVRTIRASGRDQSASEDRADVAVVIPARNEAASLPTLLASIPPGVEVVVVDDGSTDATAVVAANAGAIVVTAPPLPDCWVGKSWACAQGAQATQGQTLVFVDADVCFGTGGLDAVVRAQSDHGGLISVQPFHTPGRPVEALASIFNIVGFAGTDAGSPLGRCRGTRGAFGPVLAMARADYDAAGGHAAIRHSVVDDVALAAAFRGIGRPVQIFAGGDAVSFRMYPNGLASMVEGFTKNLAAGVRAIRVFTALLVVAWFSLLIQAAVSPVRAVVSGDAAQGAVALGLYLVVAAQYGWTARRLGRFGPWVAVAFPVSVVLFLVVFARSVAATATGRVRWRGREIPTRVARRR